MSRPRLIAELGSCHMGKLERIKLAIDLCHTRSIWGLKLQLFPNEAPYVPANIWLSPGMFYQAFEYAKEQGVRLSASVFDEESFEFLLKLEPEFIKFSYSKSNKRYWINRTLESGIEAIVSCDVMNEAQINVGATKLYCIPEYPVRYEVAFDELFPRFHGFSDHTLGLRQTKRATEAGAMIVEKHVKLGIPDEECPDAQFAVNISEFGAIG